MKLSAWLCPICDCASKSYVQGLYPKVFVSNYTSTCERLVLRIQHHV